MKQFKNYEDVCKQAHSLVKKLSDKAKKHPEKFCENYGDKEINRFIDKVNEMNLTYLQKNQISIILYQVYDITPY